MITINLQWIAYPIWLYAAWHLIQGAYIFATNINTSDIGPTIAIGYGIYYLLWAIGLCVLGWLFWRAFRQIPSKPIEQSQEVQ